MLRVLLDFSTFVILSSKRFKFSEDFFAAQMSQISTDYYLLRRSQTVLNELMSEMITFESCLPTFHIFSFENVKPNFHIVYLKLLQQATLCISMVGDQQRP